MDTKNKITTVMERRRSMGALLGALILLVGCGSAPDTGLYSAADPFDQVATQDPPDAAPARLVEPSGTGGTPDGTGGASGGSAGDSVAAGGTPGPDDAGAGGSVPSTGGRDPGTGGRVQATGGTTSTGGVTDIGGAGTGGSIVATGGMPGTGGDQGTGGALQHCIGGSPVGANCPSCDGDIVCCTANNVCGCTLLMQYDCR